MAIETQHHACDVALRLVSTSHVKTLACFAVFANEFGFLDGVFGAQNAPQAFKIDLFTDEDEQLATETIQRLC